METGRDAAAVKASSCSGAILAGGRSRRMGGRTKALLELDGKPMLQHVIDRVAPQLGRLVLSVETVSSELEPFGLAQVPDPDPGSNGPLGGLVAALRQAGGDGENWLLLVPCDAPFLPSDLARNLRRVAELDDTQLAVARYASRLQPTFSLWHRDLLDDLERAVNEERMGGFKQFLNGRSYSVHDWPVSRVNPFFNINDRPALEEARRMMSEPTGSNP